MFCGRCLNERKAAESGGPARAPSARQCHPAPNRRVQRRQHVRAAGARPGTAGGGGEPRQPPSSARAEAEGASSAKTEKGRQPGLQPTIVEPVPHPGPGEGITTTGATGMASDHPGIK